MFLMDHEEIAYRPPFMPVRRGQLRGSPSAMLSGPNAAPGFGHVCAPLYVSPCFCRAVFEAALGGI